MPVNRPLYTPPQAQQYKKAGIMPKNCFDSKSYNSLISIDIIKYVGMGVKFVDLIPADISQFGNQS